MKTVREIFKKIAQTKGWIFKYGRNDFINLIDPTDDTWHLLATPPTYKLGKTGWTLSGRFLLVSLSTIDADYDEQDAGQRWEKNIKPKIEDIRKTLDDHLYCSEDSSLDKLYLTEVINQFDANLDGIMCEYQITTNEL